jgi:hypothetical protein
MNHHVTIGATLIVFIAFGALVYVTTGETEPLFAGLLLVSAVAGIALSNWIYRKL